MDLIQYFNGIEAHPSRENISSKRKTIRSAGLLIRQFHQAGFFHGDLQLKNILVAGDQLLLIDFDRSYRKPTLSVKERMKNLLRLNRSVEKWRRFGLPITQTDRWRFFLAYAGDDRKIREAMEKTLRTYSLRFLILSIGLDARKDSWEFCVRGLEKSRFRVSDYRLLYLRTPNASLATLIFLKNSLRGWMRKRMWEKRK